MSLRSRGGARATSPISGSVRSHAHAEKFVISSKISAILLKRAAQPTARGTLATLNRPIRRRIPQAFDIGH